MTDTRTSSIVAILDNHDLMRGALQSLLKEFELRVRAFASAEEFLSSPDHGQAACLITDIRMCGMSGLELQARLNAERIRIPAIFITGHSDARLRMQAIRAGAFGFFEKPFDDEALMERVRAAMAL